VIQYYFFSTVLLKRTTKRLKLTKKIHILIYRVFKRFCWLSNEPLNKLPLAMKHVARVFSGFQTHSDRCRCGEETTRVGRARVEDKGREQVRFLKFLGMRGGRLYQGR